MAALLFARNCSPGFPNMILFILAITPGRLWNRPFRNRNQSVHVRSMNGFFKWNRPLVILACINSVSLQKATAHLQQHDLLWSIKTKECGACFVPNDRNHWNLTRTGMSELLATTGTVQVGFPYPIEIKKFFPSANVFQQAARCGAVDENMNTIASAPLFLWKNTLTILSIKAQLTSIPSYFSAPIIPVIT